MDIIEKLVATRNNETFDEIRTGIFTFISQRSTKFKFYHLDRVTAENEFALNLHQKLFCTENIMAEFIILCNPKYCYLLCKQ